MVISWLAAAGSLSSYRFRSAQGLKKLESTLPDLTLAGFVLEYIEKRRARRLQFLFQPRRAVAVAASPRLAAILISALAAVVRILHASQVEVLFPVRPLLLQRSRAVADFHPARGLVRTEPRVLHVSQIFAFCNRSLPQRLLLDGLEQISLTTGFYASS